MATKSTGVARFDRNRFRRVYPYVRRSRKLTSSTAGEEVNETATVSFVAQSSKTYNFTEQFTSTPVVILTSTEDTVNNGSVNLHISSLSSTSVTIEATTDLTGDVYLFASDVIGSNPIDGNRFRRNYPGIRRVPVFTLVGGAAGGIAIVTVETAEVSFSAQSSVTYNFTSSFSTAPTVMLTPGEDGVNNGGVNVFISAISNTSVTIETSDDFTGTVYLHARGT